MSQPSNLALKEATTAEEFNVLFDVVWKAFHRPYEPFVTLCFPSWGASAADFEAAIVRGRSRLWNEHLSNPSSHWIYVVDTVSGEVIGGTQWVVFEKNPFADGPPKLEAPWWPAGEGRDFLECILKQIFFPRSSWMRKPHLGLNWMAVHPQHRKHGVGSLLMEWGIKRADELHLECFIEASDMGTPLYSKFGFRTLMKFTVSTSKPDPSEQWLRYEHELTPDPIRAMWRPAGGIWLEDGKQKMPWEPSEPSNEAPVAKVSS